MPQGRSKSSSQDEIMAFSIYGVDGTMLVEKSRTSKLIIVVSH